MLCKCINKINKSIAFYEKDYAELKRLTCSSLKKTVKNKTKYIFFVKKIYKKALYLTN